MEERMEYQYDPQGIAQTLKWQLEDGSEPIKGAAQSYLDIAAWENFLLAYPIKSIIELGTGYGSFSKWLRERCENFLTIDNKQPYHDIEEFKKLEIFSDHGRDVITQGILTAPRPLIFYCDNGNKAREVEEYSKLLIPGDYLAAHDFQIEIHPQDIPDEFEPVLNQGLTAFFRRV